MSGIMDNPNVKKSVRQVFEEYLESRKMRKTPERFAILETVYSINGHFDMEALMKSMMEKHNFRVSRATLYNTLALLEEAKLVMHHKLKTISQYEKSYNVESHYHQICTECGKMIEFNGELMRKGLESSHSRRFTVTNYTLYVYGVCGKCSAAIKRRQKKLLKNKDKNHGGK